MPGKCAANAALRYAKLILHIIDAFVATPRTPEFPFAAFAPGALAQNETNENEYQIRSLSL